MATKFPIQFFLFPLLFYFEKVTPFANNNK